MFHPPGALGKRKTAANPPSAHRAAANIRPMFSCEK
jgi:hypothetical protein